MSDEGKEQASTLDSSKEEQESDTEQASMEQDEDTGTSQGDKSVDKSEDEDGDDDKKEDEEEGEEEEESEDDEPQVGLLEKPLILEEGKKRERKKVERMTFKTDESAHEAFVIKEGKGRSLGDIPYIEHKLSRTKAEDSKPLHRLLFRRIGSVNDVKKNIRQFSGFPFSKDDVEYEKRVQLLKGKSYTTVLIKKIMDILDIARGGTKEDLITRLMEWLEKPKDSGRKLPQPKRKRKSKGGSEKKTKGKKQKKEPKKKPKKSKDTTDDDDDDDVEDKDDDQEESDKAVSDVSDISDDEEEAPPKKKVKKATPKPKEKKKPAPKVKTPKSAVKKKATPKKKAKVSNEEVSDVSSDSDDEPLATKQNNKGPPTNDELKDVVKKMLDSANLEQVTMKTVLKDVFAKYPDHDLADRKDFIKNTVKQIIS